MNTIKEKLEFLARFHVVPVTMFTNDDHKTKQFECPKIALKIFLKDYAFEKSGAAMAYKYMAVKAINNTKINFKNIKDEEIKNLWKEFEKQKTENDEIGLNVNCNPLFTNKDSNNRAKHSILTVLRMNNIENLADGIYKKLSIGEINKAYDLLIKIRGIGPKIASLYLRDIAFLKKNELFNDRINLSKNENYYLLQPIDTWLEQAFKILDNKNIKNADEIKNEIIRICLKNGVNALEFNKGAWYFGSRLAKTYKRLKDALEDNSKAEEYIKDTLEIGKKEFIELNKLS
jgi:hypothetical protein